jgi:hypothetical protein
VVALFRPLVGQPPPSAKSTITYNGSFAAAGVGVKSAIAQPEKMAATVQGKRQLHKYPVLRYLLEFGRRKK